MTLYEVLTLLINSALLILTVLMFLRDCKYKK